MKCEKEVCDFDKSEYDQLRNEMTTLKSMANQLFIYSVTVQVAIATLFSVVSDGRYVEISVYEFESIKFTIELLKENTLSSNNIAAGFILIIVSLVFLFKITVHKIEQFYAGTYIKIFHEKSNINRWVTFNRQFKGSCLNEEESQIIQYANEYRIILYFHIGAICYYLFGFCVGVRNWIYYLVSILLSLIIIYWVSKSILNRLEKIKSNINSKMEQCFNDLSKNKFPSKITFSCSKSESKISVFSILFFILGLFFVVFLSLIMWLAVMDIIKFLIV